MRFSTSYKSKIMTGAGCIAAYPFFLLHTGNGTLHKGKDSHHQEQNDGSDATLPSSKPGHAQQPAAAREE